MHCIPFAFSQCFMHLAMCLNVENYVLLGLDWVEPMIHFFCTSHILAFFMHTYPLLFYCWYFVVIFFFFLFLSLSPSLSLLDRLHMAPKRKSTPSRNLLCSNTSSSDPTPTHVWFCDRKAHQDFLENFSKHGIHLERRVVLSDFSDIALPTIIHSQVWESLCEIPVRCPTVIMKELYSNMHGFDTFIP